MCFGRPGHGTSCIKQNPRFYGPRLGAFCEVEADGQWYGLKLGSVHGPLHPLKPSEEVKEWVSVSLEGKWLKEITGFERGKADSVGEGQPFKLTPGKHRIRAAFAPWPEGVRPVSKAVEIEVVKKDEG